MDSREIAFQCSEIADDKKASDIVILDLADLLVITDYFVLCTGVTERKLKSIEDEIEATLKKLQIKCKGIEGYQEGKWILMDYGWVIIHLYLEEVRLYYELEDLWADAPRISWERNSVNSLK